MWYTGESVLIKLDSSGGRERPLNTQRCGGERSRAVGDTVLSGIVFGFADVR